MFTSTSETTISRGSAATYAPTPANSALEAHSASITAHLYSAIELTALLDAVDAATPATRQILQACGMNTETAVDAAQRLSFRDLAAAYRIALDQVGDGLALSVGRRLHLTSFGIAGLALLSSATLHDAIRRMQQWWPLFGLKFQLSLVHCQESVRILLLDRFSMPDATGGCLARLDLVKLITVFRDLLGDGFAPSIVGVRDAGRTTDANLSGFAGAAIQAGGDWYLEIPQELLHRRMPQAHLVTHRNAADVCDVIMDKLFFEPPVIRNVKKQLCDLDAGVPTLGDVARRLCMSERTLRRRLRDSGTSYQCIIEEVRMQMAKQFLNDRSMSTQHIAERLGYAEPGNFRNAFKRWTGASPQRFRAALLSAAG